MQITYGVIGGLIATLGIGWLLSEVRSARSSVRIAWGSMFWLASVVGMLGISNSVGSYYESMRDHETALDLIKALPGKRAAIEAWAARHADAVGMDFQAARQELDAIIAPQE